MGYARYVGRVGALAVALGIGVAVANGPAAAWADGDGGSSSGTAGSSGSDTASSSTSPSDSGATDSASGESSSSASTSSPPDDVAGAESDENSDAEASDDEPTVGASDPAPRKTVVERKGTRGSERASVPPRKWERKPRSSGDVAATPPSAPKPKRWSVAKQDEDTTRPVAGAADARVAVQVTAAPVAAAEVIDAKAAPSTTPEPRTAVTSLLARIGLSPLASGGPEDAPDSPVAWAVFAALRRQSEKDAGNEQQVLSVADPIVATLSVEGEAEPMMAMMAVTANSAPSASPTVGLPEIVNGTVTGKVNATDSEGNPLTYAVQSQSSGSTVTVDGSGNFTYTPSQAARVQAAATTGLDTDTFTVRVSDGQTFTDVPVTVTVRPGQLANGAPVDVGRDPSVVAFNADGSRAYVTNQYDKTVSVINTSNGTVLATIAVPYAPKAVVVSPVAGQNRAYVAMSSGVAVIDTLNNRVVDINTGTAAVDMIKVGSSPSAIAINPTGTRLYVSNGGSSTVSVINTTTNLEIARVSVGSQPSGLIVSPDGTRVYALSRGTDKVTVFRASDNVVIGSAAVGDSPRSIVLSPNGQTAYVSNYSSGTVTVLNTSANTPTLVKTITVGTQPEGIAMTKDGTLVYVANGRDTVSVITTATNAVSSTITIDSPAESNAHAIAVSGNTVYVTDYYDDWVRVVNLNRVQTAPQANGNPTVGQPDSLTAAVSGDLKVIDTDGDVLNYSVTDAPDKGTLIVNPNGTYTYTPTEAARRAAGVNTTDAFTVRVSDSLAAKDVTVTVPVVPMPPDPNNHAPVASPSVFSQDPLTGAVTGTVRISDADGDPLGFTAIGTPAHGQVSFNWSTGAFAYTPSHAARLAADQTVGSDTDSFTVTVSDGETTTTTVVTVPLSPAKLTQNPTAIPVGAGVAGIVIPGGYAVVVNQTTGMVTVIDTATNTVKGTVPAGAGATSVASTYNNTFAYVALRDENAVSVINTWSITGERWIPVGPQPWGIVAAPNYQHVYVTNSGSNYVSIIDTYSKTVVGAIAVGNNPMGAAISADSARLYVANRGSSTLSIVDTASRSVVATVPVGANPVAVALNSAGTRAYVSNLAGTISVVDIAAPTPTVVASVAVGPEPYSMALSPDGTLYVVNRNDTMSVIDTGTNTVVRTVTIDTAAENGLHFVAVDPYGRVYVTDGADGVVRSFTATPSASTTIPTTSTATQVGSNPSLVAVSGNRAYVLNSGNQTISVVDTSTKQVTATIPVSATALGVAVAPNGQHLYVADYDSVSVINTSTRQVVADVVIPDLCAAVCYGSTVGLTDLAISPNGERVYVIQAYATDIGPWGSVAVIQTSDNSLIYNEFSAYVTDLEYTADGSRLFYTQGDYRFVHVSDFTTGQTPVIEVSTPDSGWAVPLAIAVRPDGLRAYVVVDSEMFDSLGAKYVAVIDTDRSSPTYNTVIGHFSAPYGAQDVAVSADGRRLYISLADGKTVEVVDTSTNAVLGYFTRPGAGAMAVGTDGTLYFTDPATGRMHSVTVGVSPAL